ncbi:MAG: DUF4199 domain-containing protein, partial [Bacteroidia bacterium]|nr:DUF4199 domain-containing protein [Bacteroidia bacterium]
MESSRSQLKVAMNFGAMYGLAGIAISLIFYFTGASLESKIPQILTYLAQLIIIIIGIKSYRDNDLGGYIGYGKAVGTGLLISIFGGILAGAFSVIFFSFIAPDMVDRILAAAQQNMIDKGMSEEQIEMGLEWTKKFMTPGWLFIFSIISAAFFG